MPNKQLPGTNGAAETIPDYLSNESESATALG